MFCRCVLCAMATKHQEHITVASVDGNYLFTFTLYILTKKSADCLIKE